MDKQIKNEMKNLQCEYDGNEVPYYSRGGGSSKTSKSKKRKKQPKDKVHIGPKGGKYVIRNGKKVYTAMIGRAERMFTSMVGDPSKTASENNVPVSFVTYNRMVYSPD